MLFSCQNDLKTIESYADDIDELPEIVAKDVVIFRSDSGSIVAKLISKNVQHFGGKDPYIEFPEGMFVLLYDRNMNEETIIEADYGKSYEKRKLMVAKKNVIVKNLIKKQQLYTEEIFWDQQKRIIYTDVDVKIVTSSETIYGSRFQSDEHFNHYEILNPQGKVEIQENTKSK